MIGEAINPTVLVWARETAGFSVDEAAQKIGLKSGARGTAVQSGSAESRGLAARIDRSRFHAGRQKLEGACKISAEAVEQREIIGAVHWEIPVREKYVPGGRSLQSIPGRK